MELKIGKLDSKLMEEIVFSNIRCKRPEVLVHSGIGKDCASVDFGGYNCILSTDPITAAVGEIGRIAIDVSANDIATNGIEPLGIMLAVLLPEGTTEEQVRTIMTQAGEEAARLNIEIIGGHTEITNAVVKPIIVSTAIGRATKAEASTRPLRPIRPGDAILMTKYAGLEGTGIIAGDFQQKLIGLISEKELAEAMNMIENISVVKEGAIAGRIGFSGMHDITEGGILGAVWEMCEVADTGAEIFREEIPVLGITEKICGIFNIDYLKLISSGCMLIITPEGSRKRLLDALSAENIPASVIGRITEGEKYIIEADGTRNIIDPPGSDEIYKVVG